MDLILLLESVTGILLMIMIIMIMVDTLNTLNGELLPNGEKGQIGETACYETCDGKYFYSQGGAFSSATCTCGVPEVEE